MHLTRRYSVAVFLAIFLTSFRPIDAFKSLSRRPVKIPTTRGLLDPGYRLVTSLKTRNYHEYNESANHETYSCKSSLQTAQRTSFVRWTSAVMLAANTLLSSCDMVAHAVSIQSGYPESTISEGVLANTADRVGNDYVERNDVVPEFTLDDGILTHSFFTELIVAEFPAYENEVAKLTIQSPTSKNPRPGLSLKSSVQPNALHSTYYTTNQDGLRDSNYEQIFASAFSDFPPPSFTKLYDDDLVVSMPPKILESDPNKSGNAVVATTFKQQDDSIAGILEFALGALTFGGVALSFTGRGGTPADNTPIAKVVMVQPEPYGLGNGRNWYNGVDVTADKAMLTNDVRQYCDAGQGVTRECAQSIAGYLEAATTLSPQEKDETTRAIISYLESLSGGVNGSFFGSSDLTKRGSAFSSYVEALSIGSVPGPSSAESVANYLNSLASNPVVNRSSPHWDESQITQSSDDVYEQDFYLERENLLSKIEQRVEELESSVDHLPDKLSLRLEKWQRMQDERLRKEVSEILSRLVPQQRRNTKS